MGEVIFTVAHHRGDIKALDIVESVFTVAVYRVIDRTLVISLENIDMYDFRFALFGLAFLVFPYEYLVTDADHFVGSVTVEQDDVINVGTVGHEFILLQ